MPCGMRLYRTLHRRSRLPGTLRHCLLPRLSLHAVLAGISCRQLWQRDAAGAAGRWYAPNTAGLVPHAGHWQGAQGSLSRCASSGCTRTSPPHTPPPPPHTNIQPQYRRPRPRRRGERPRMLTCRPPCSRPSRRRGTGGMGAVAVPLRRGASAAGETALAAARPAAHSLWAWCKRMRVEEAWPRQRPQPKQQRQQPAASCRHLSATSRRPRATCLCASRAAPIRV